MELCGERIEPLELSRGECDVALCCRLTRRLVVSPLPRTFICHLFTGRFPICHSSDTHRSSTYTYPAYTFAAVAVAAASAVGVVIRLVPVPLSWDVSPPRAPRAEKVTFPFSRSHQLQQQQQRHSRKLIQLEQPHSRPVLLLL